MSRKTEDTVDTIISYLMIIMLIIWIVLSLVTTCKILTGGFVY